MVFLDTVAILGALRESPQGKDRHDEKGMKRVVGKIRKTLRSARI
jgi:hypothetical protein